MEKVFIKPIKAILHNDLIQCIENDELCYKIYELGTKKREVCKIYGQLLGGLVALRCFETFCYILTPLNAVNIYFKNFMCLCS